MQRVLRWQLRQRRAPKLDRARVAKQARPQRAQCCYLAADRRVIGERMLLDPIEQRLGSGVVGVEARDICLRQQQSRPARQQRSRQARQPVAERDMLAIQRQRQRLRGDQVGGALDIAGQQGLLDRLADQLLALEPRAGAAVQLGHCRSRRCAPKPLAQHAGEQLVVAIPMPLGVEWRQE